MLREFTLQLIYSVIFSSWLQFIVESFKSLKSPVVLLWILFAIIYQLSKLGISALVMCIMIQDLALQQGGYSICIFLDVFLNTLSLQNAFLFSPIQFKVSVEVITCSFDFFQFLVFNSQCSIQFCTYLQCLHYIGYFLLVSIQLKELN